MQIGPALDPRRTWVIADTHFGHANIATFCHRPDHHDKIMVDAWREAVPETGATLLHLGDITFRGEDEFHRIIAPRLTGERKLLLLGNHDNEPHEFYEYAGFQIIEPFAMYFGPDSVEVEFDHYPHDARVDGNPYPPEGTWRVHGHIHNNGYGPPPEWPAVPYMLRQINVSAEMLKYRPINLHVLLSAAIL
jgi:calcineurin-like phosphoesterase family protein